MLIGGLLVLRTAAAIMLFHTDAIDWLRRR
jgi:hypothetical protein